jgi:hypothetical protein
VAEAAHQVEALEEHGRISRGGGPLAPGETHAVEERDEGAPRLVRRRFSAI